ncbi:hypothetical protein C8J57DRAFT_1241494 [Mycena rebaudengoi]|nr:hypothetical protein C8J57DRAFT_1241494 [Mycena rebaudengoi]
MVRSLFVPDQIFSSIPKLRKGISTIHMDIVLPSARRKKFRRAWRKLHIQWMVDARLEEMEAEESREPVGLSEPPASAGASRWLPCPLSHLFGGTIARHIQRRSRAAFTEEERLMELLGAEHSDEESDDGELEGSGDGYDE